MGPRKVFARQRAVLRRFTEMIPFFFVALAVVSFFPRHSVAAEDIKKPLRGGWNSWFPYQYLEKREHVEILTGLDIVLVGEILKHTGYDAKFTRVQWKRRLLDIKNGTLDFAPGASMTPGRKRYAYFSEPYRTESNVLMVRKGESSGFEFWTIKDLLQAVRSGRFRLGVESGSVYGSTPLNRFIQNPKNASRIAPVSEVSANFINLFKDRIDGFFVDRIVGATLAWRNQWQSSIQEHPLDPFTGAIHVMFNKKTTSPAVVEAFNRGMDELHQSGRYDNIIQQYMFPILLSITIEQDWFFGLEILGTVAFAISGLILARRGSYDLVGAFVLAALPALGGGIMRDLLVGRRPLGVLRTPAYLLTVIITVLLGCVILRIYSIWQERKSASPSVGAAPLTERLLRWDQLS